MRHLVNAGKTNPIQSQYKPKQTQFPKRSKMNVSYIITRGYENKPRFQAKTKQTQFKPNQTQSVVSLPALSLCILSCVAVVEGSAFILSEIEVVEGVEPISKAKNADSRVLPARPRLLWAFRNVASSGI